MKSPIQGLPFDMSRGWGVTLVVLCLLLGGGCRRKLDISDASPDASPSSRSSALAPPEAPPCLDAPGSFAEVGARLSVNLVTLLGNPADDSGPGAALPLFEPAFQAALPNRADPDAAALGAGFLLGPQGLIVTSYQLVREMPSVTVRLHDGSLLQATFRGAAPEIDLALLALDQPARAAVELTDASRLRPGDWVAVLSDPFGSGLSLTAGVIRARSRADAPSFPRSLMPFLMVDAAIDAANWGGLVVDPGGRMVGLAASASSAGSQIGLVLPAAELRRRVTELTESGSSSRSWIGLWARSISAIEAADLGLNSPRGLLVTRVVPAGPAHEAGLLPGDVILEFSGEPVRSPAALGALASRVEANQSANLSVWRDRRQLSLRLSPAPMPH